MITSRHNPLVKRARALRQARARRESGLFLVEGIFHVGEALAAGWPLETLLYAPDLLRSAYARQLVADYEAKGGQVQALSPAAFASFASKEHPQGLAAIARQRPLELNALPPLRRAAALVQPQDPGNVGAILRTLDAVGAETLFLLDGGVDAYHPTLVRASMGALFWHPPVRAGSEAFFRWAEWVNAFVVGTSAHAETDWRELRCPPERPVVLLLGSEQKGLTPSMLARCAAQVRLPMRGRVTSLNLSVAAGVLLYALWG